MLDVCPDRCSFKYHLDCFASLLIAYDKFERGYSLIMRNVNVHLHLVNFFCTICLHIDVIGSIWH